MHLKNKNFLIKCSLINYLCIKFRRLRNPWGEKESYNGPWSANSQEWNKVSEEIRKELDIQENGEFFMSFKDFFDAFDDIDFVHINLNSFYTVGKDYNENITWVNSFFAGEWTKGKTAGGDELYLLFSYWLFIFLEHFPSLRIHKMFYFLCNKNITYKN